jgi:dienelactone hydrolase
MILGPDSQGAAIMKRTLAGLLLVLALAPTGRAEVKTKVAEYELGKDKFKGVFYWDDSVKGKRPGVLVIHEWWGLGPHEKAAFACDMYGEGKLTEHPKEAKAMAGVVRSNLETWQGRAKAGLDQLKKFELTDPDKLAAIGYCFGGSTALQLAYAGADLKAVSTFHAALPAPDEKQAKSIKARILINHGADDAFIPEKAINAFKKALDEAKVDYKFISYPGAVHSFTVVGTDKKSIKGMAYDEKADKESWKATTELFKKAFGEK